MVKKKGNKFQLISKSGRVMGTHDTRKQAAAQERAIKASQAKRK